ncbi:MAG: STAS domain-containing protein [Carboxylicivirga sp.]|jgi:L-lysine 2,3-aminomutase|nr:STAS domain-containing protein [Carboxylicivirga sp.]
METLPYTVICNELPEKSIVRFSGQLIINHIEKITDEVKNQLSFDKDLHIEINNPDSIDVTFIQLLLTLKTTLKGNGKQTVISSELNDDLKVLLNNSGFQYVLN